MSTNEITPRFIRPITSSQHLTASIFIQSKSLNRVLSQPNSDPMHEATVAQLVAARSPNDERVQCEVGGRISFVCHSAVVIMVRRVGGAGEVAVYDVASRGPGAILNPASSNARITQLQRRLHRKKNLQDTDVQLIQDLEFPTVANRVKQSADGQFLAAVGTYPPQVRVYDLEQLSMKFQRHLDSEIVDFQYLTNDWRKMVFLCADRTLEFHAQFGTYYKVRIPIFGRDLAFHKQSSELFVSGSSQDVHRLNLEHGRFFAPLKTSAAAGVNCVSICPVTNLLAFGTETEDHVNDPAAVEIWDARQLSQRSGYLNVSAALARHSRSLSRIDASVTCVRFDETDGITMGVGTKSGHVMLFDLRSPHAPFAKEQGFDSAIRSLRLLPSSSSASAFARASVDNETRFRMGSGQSRSVLSADARSIKVWNRDSFQENVVSLESTDTINHVCCIRESGVLFAACEAPKIRAYYIPSLGLAPGWCSFLENVTDELEMGAIVAGSNHGIGADRIQEETVYENYRFVTRDELEKLNATELIGSNMLKPALHGYFMHLRLYRKLMDAADPFAYDKYRREKAREKLEKERESRIAKVSRRRLAGTGARQSNVTANVELFQQMLDQQRSGSATEKQKRASTQLLGDERFAAMFENKLFQVDANADRFQQLKVGRQSTEPGQKVTIRESDDSEDSTNSSGSSESDSESRGRAERSKSKNGNVRDADESESSNDSDAILPKVKRRGNEKVQRRGVEFYEGQDAHVALLQKTNSAELDSERRKLKREQKKNAKLTLAQRLAKIKQTAEFDE